jgi:hypothetical protein
MLYYTLLTLTTLQPAPNSSPPGSSANFVAVHVDAFQTDARGLQIVTVRLTIDPARRLCGNSEAYEYRSLKLSVKTGDPKTRVDVVYPKGNAVEFSYYRVLEGEVAIQAIVQRAPGDKSPLEGTVDFCVHPIIVRTIQHRTVPIYV